MMEAGRPSSTALGAARLRAAHQVLDDPKILDDPLALRIVDRDCVVALQRDPARFQVPRLHRLRASIVLRSRYAEDRLRDAVARGTRQYVILGAGLDTFAYRNPYADVGLRVFEVDHPATQAWKHSRLADADIAEPSSVTFVPIDFERQTLADGLAAAGFRGDQPAFFSWLGVTMYLSKESVMSTLDWIASATAPRSEVVFSYVVTETPLASRAADLGEPWVTYFDPPTLARDLAQLGFSHLEDLGPEDANRRYFANRTDGLQLMGTGRVMAARV